MLKIKLQRRGKKREAHYRVVVVQSEKARDSRYLVDLGYYNPHTNPTDFNIDKDLAAQWLKNGAQPTETVAQFFVKLGLVKKLHRGSVQAKPKPKKKEQGAAPAAN